MVFIGSKYVQGTVRKSDMEFSHHSFGKLRRGGVFPKYDDIHVVISEPRLLEARAVLPAFTVLIADTHGNHSGDKPEAVAAHWTHAVEAIAKVRKDDEHVLLLTDANAHLHEIDSDDA